MIAILLLLAVAGATDLAQHPVLHVAVPANFQLPHAALEPLFEEQCGCDLRATFGSTGKLRAQIAHGAPFQVFLAADTKHPAELVAEGLAVKGSQFTYAIGKLALYTTHPGLEPESALKAGMFTHLAVAKADLAPYGAAALQALERMHLLEQARPRLVYGDNITQAYQFVRSGAAELGFVAYAQVIEEDPAQYWVVPEDSHDPIAQDAVLLSSAKDDPHAQAYLQFLKSEAAREVIRRFGYGFPEDGE